MWPADREDQPEPELQAADGTHAPAHGVPRGTSLLQTVTFDYILVFA